MKCTLAGESGALFVGRVSGPFLFAACVAVTIAQSAPPVDVSGRILDVDRHAPIAGARVTLGSGPGQSYHAVSAADGRFVFPHVNAGSYELTAEKTGYSPGAYEQRWPDGPAAHLTVTAGTSVTVADVPLWKLATISGCVDDDRDPLVGVEVRALAKHWVGGRMRLENVRQSTTDDRGCYRLSELVAGDYLVEVPSARLSLPASSTSDGVLIGTSRVTGTNESVVTVGSAPGAALSVFPLTFAPGVATPDAALSITLASGADRAGVDVPMHRMRGLTVSGRVSDAAGTAVGFASVHLGMELPAGLVADNRFEVASAVADADGRFVLYGVPPGRYRLSGFRFGRDWSDLLRLQSAILDAYMGVMGSPPGARRTAVRDPNHDLNGEVNDVDVVDKAVDVALPVAPSARISGTVVFDGTAGPPDEEAIHSLSVATDAADGHALAFTPASGVATKGSFTSSDLPPGAYRLSLVGELPDWRLVAMMYDGQDRTTVPIDLGTSDVDGVVVRMTRSPGPTLTGRVTADGRPDAAAAVVLFPRDPAAWRDFGPRPRRIRLVATDADGRYMIPDAPAGDYLVAAFSASAARDWQRAGFLDEASRVAAPCTLRDAQALTLNLTAR